MVSQNNQYTNNNIDNDIFYQINYSDGGETHNIYFPLGSQFSDTHYIITLFITPNPNITGDMRLSDPAKTYTLGKYNIGYLIPTFSYGQNNPDVFGLLQSTTPDLTYSSYLNKMISITSSSSVFAFSF